MKLVCDLFAEGSRLIANTSSSFVKFFALVAGLLPGFGPDADCANLTRPTETNLENAALQSSRGTKQSFPPRPQRSSEVLVSFL